MALSSKNKYDGSSSNNDVSQHSHIDVEAAKCCQRANTRGLMYRLGYCIGSFPAIIFILTMAVTALSGAIFVTEVSSGYDLGYLWIPESTQAASSYRRVLPLLSTGLAQSRKVSVLVEPYLSSNILTLRHLERIWELNKGKPVFATTYIPLFIHVLPLNLQISTK